MPYIVAQDTKRERFAMSNNRGHLTFKGFRADGSDEFIARVVYLLESGEAAKLKTNESGQLEFGGKKVTASANTIAQIIWQVHHGPKDCLVLQFKYNLKEHVVHVSIFGEDYNFWVRSTREAAPVATGPFLKRVPGIPKEELSRMFPRLDGREGQASPEPPVEGEEGETSPGVTPEEGVPEDGGQPTSELPVPEGNADPASGQESSGRKSRRVLGKSRRS